MLNSKISLYNHYSLVVALFGSGDAVGMTSLLGLEQQDSVVSKVKVDKVFRLVSYEGAEVSSYYAMPCWTSSFIELLIEKH